MLSERYVSTLKPGDIFRDWLIRVLGDKIRNKECDVEVYKIEPASHIVCRYEFVGENYGVIAKFYAEPTGSIKSYRPAESMEIEFNRLKKLEKIIDVPKPVAMREDFSCVLVTEYVYGKTLYSYMEAESELYDKLAAVAQLLRRLHENTKSEYRKQDEFAHFHKILDQLRLDRENRIVYDRLLGDWWYSTLLDTPYGCMIHNDANPVNYVFSGNKVYALDFESSWEHANPVHDLGIIAAELKYFFAIHKNDAGRAEPYINHLLLHYSQDKSELYRIIKALPFFMALGTIRIAKLDTGKDHSTYAFRGATNYLKNIYSELIPKPWKCI